MNNCLVVSQGQVFDSSENSRLPRKIKKFFTSYARRWSFFMYRLVLNEHWDYTATVPPHSLQQISLMTLAKLEFSALKLCPPTLFPSVFKFAWKFRNWTLMTQMIVNWPLSEFSLKQIVNISYGYYPSEDHDADLPSSYIFNLLEAVAEHLEVKSSPTCTKFDLALSESCFSWMSCRDSNSPSRIAQCLTRIFTMTFDVSVSLILDSELLPYIPKSSYCDGHSVDYYGYDKRYEEVTILLGCNHGSTVDSHASRCSPLLVQPGNLLFNYLSESFSYLWDLLFGSIVNSLTSDIISVKASESISAALYTCEIDVNLDQDVMNKYVYSRQEAERQFASSASSCSALSFITGHLSEIVQPETEHMMFIERLFSNLSERFSNLRELEISLYHSECPNLASVVLPSIVQNAPGLEVVKLEIIHAPNSTYLDCLSVLSDVKNLTRFFITFHSEDLRDLSDFAVVFNSGFEHLQYLGIEVDDETFLSLNSLLDSCTSLQCLRILQVEIHSLHRAVFTCEDFIDIVKSVRHFTSLALLIISLVKSTEATTDVSAQTLTSMNIHEFASNLHFDVILFKKCQAVSCFLFASVFLASLTAFVFCSWYFT